MRARSPWTRKQLMVALYLYCRLPFGKLHSRNPEIIRVADAIGRTPSALAMKLVNIASLDDAITSTGRTGLTGASAHDRAIWNEMQGNWDRFAEESRQVAWEFMEAADGETAQDENAVPVGRDRMVHTTARVGQSFFRAAVLSAYDGACCITGLALPTLLVASHIVPWRCNPHHRTNPRNGLLLSALHDKAFDAGLITLNPDLTVRLSPRLAVRENAFLAISMEAYAGQPIARPQKFGPDPYLLAFHREHIFQQ